MTDTINQKKRKGNYNPADLRQLVDGVKANTHILFSPLCSTITNGEKKRVWCEITEKLNASSTVPRTAEEIRKKWQDLRSQVKKKLAENKRLSNKTGGGPPPPPLNDLEQEVASTIPDCQISGIEGGLESAFDSDIPSCNSVVNVSKPTLDVFTPEKPLTPAALPEQATSSQLTSDLDPVMTVSHAAQPCRKISKPNYSEEFVTLKKKKMQTSNLYKTEMLSLERRKTEALERIAQSLEVIQARLPLEPQPFSLSPVISFTNSL